MPRDISYSHFSLVGGDYISFYRRDGIVYIDFGDGFISIDDTQLQELGALLIALGGGSVDLDDVNELLDGYDGDLKFNMLESVDD